MSDWVTPFRGRNHFGSPLKPPFRAEDEPDDSWAARQAKFESTLDWITRNYDLNWELFLDMRTGLIFGYRIDNPFHPVPQVELPDECNEGCDLLRAEP